jgi:hypothetical protein
MVGAIVVVALAARGQLGGNARELRAHNRRSDFDNLPFFAPFNG